MLRSRHPRDRALLMALDGELSRRREAAVDAHVSACVECQLRLRQIRTSLADATGLYASAFGPPATADHTSRVRLDRALEQAADEWNYSWLARLRSVLALPARQAGVLLAAVALVAFVWVPPSRESRHRPTPELGSPLPIASVTPGAVSGLTAGELCAGARPSRLVTADSRERVVRDYRMENVSARSYELDALITPELGGTTAPGNLWPQRYESPVWNARIKDELEKLLPTLVCSGQLELGLAQQEMARDWVAAYKRHFKTEVPLQAHLGAPVADDDLELSPVRRVAENSAPMVLSLRFARR